MPGVDRFVSEPGALATGSRSQLVTWSQYHPRKRMGQRLNIEFEQGCSVARFAGSGR
jgi:hypothetical protein